ncbi:alpha/beta hydrolase [Nocardia sp. CDC159]|uniref:Alpha/beta hydrolase n=1 Tax=Nocardia pulmonis TaxID=2951408 RepID=A0A9X2E5H6_9NOCA|nr:MULTISPECIES: alpha/beta hydrolase [Nocardia]MCM6771958.1 alpha/beta hydrolase [Nocardia pulmonis]MCM6785384.1 alpha/beta hydrolase [Nocardia sp. CDC159]
MIDDVTDTTEARPRRPHRRRRIALAAVAGTLVAALIGWLAVRDTAPVGHFTSAAGYDEYLRTYRRAMAELPPPSASLDLRTDYGVVRMYRFDGADPQSPPLLLLPGRAAAAPMWADNLASLRRLRTVYLVDLLGEPGASVQSRPIVDDAEQAAWLHQAIAQLPVREIVLVGVSIGGWTATNLAIRQPDRIGGVVVLDPVMTFAPMSWRAVLRSIPASVRWFPKRWRDDFNSWTAGGAPVERVPVADMIEAGMRHYRIALPAPTTFDDAQLRGLAMPYLAIIAGRSVMHDSAAAATHARRVLPRGTVAVYEDASHALNGEYPDRIAADIAAFLSGSG